MSADGLPRVLLAGAVLGQPMGGVRRHNAELLPRLGQLLTAGGGALAVLEGVTPVAFPLPEPIERLASTVPAGPPSARFVREGAALRRALERARRAGCPFDLVHTAHLPAPRVPLPYTLTVHDLRSIELRAALSPRRFVSRRILRAALANAAATITVSEHVRAKLVAHFRLDPQRTFLVPNAADHFEPLPRRPDASAPLLCLGHLERRKNVALLLRALALDSELPPLLLAGRSVGSERGRLERRARALGVTARVTFLGSVSDAELPGLFARAACLVLPSWVEGFGIPVLEAQRARLPVAVSRAGALREVAGPDAPSFDPHDAAACAGAVRRALASTPEERERAAARADGFGWDRSARAWLDALCAALSASRAGAGPL